jgi:hypothetical protein
MLSVLFLMIQILFKLKEDIKQEKSLQATLNL